MCAAQRTHKLHYRIVVVVVAVVDVLIGGGCCIQVKSKVVKYLEKRWCTPVSTSHGGRVFHPMTRQQYYVIVIKIPTLLLLFLLLLPVLCHVGAFKKTLSAFKSVEKLTFCGVTHFFLGKACLLCCRLFLCLLMFFVFRFQALPVDRPVVKPDQSIILV